MVSTLSASPALLVRESSTAARWRVLVGALMVQLILGTIYGYSVFRQPLETRLWPQVLSSPQAQAILAAGGSLPADAVVLPDATQVAREHALRQGYLKYAFAVCLLSFAASMVFAGRLQDVIGPRITATVGGALLGVGFLLAGFFSTPVIYQVCHGLLMGAAALLAALAVERLSRAAGLTRSTREALKLAVVTSIVVVGVALGFQAVRVSLETRVLMLWLTIGLIAGAGVGFAYVCPIAALVKWFPAHKGLVSGIAVAGFGFGAYLFSGKSVLGAVGFIERYGVEAFFRIHALVSVAIVGAGAWLLCNPPSSRPPGRPGLIEAKEAGWRDLLRTGRFYLVWLMFFSGAMAGLMIIGILKPFAGSQLVEAALRDATAIADSVRNDLLLQGAQAVGVLAIFNAAGRIVWGLLSDRIGRTRAMTLMFIFQGVTMLALITLDTRLELALGAACVGFNFGGNFALFPSLTADLFGSKNFGANYGWVFTSYGIAGVIGVWVGNTAQRVTGSYFAAFALAAALCLISAGLAATIRRRDRAAGGA